MDTKVVEFKPMVLQNSDQLFLTSSISYVAHDLIKWLPFSPKNKKLMFITTASEVEKGDLEWQNSDVMSLINSGFDVSQYTLTGQEPDEIAKDLAQYDVLHMGGGNSFYLLQQIQKTKFLPILSTWMKKGGIYIGTSAGSIVASPDISPFQILDPKLAPFLEGTQGLSLTDLLIFPHWGSVDFKELYLNQRLGLAYTERYKITLLTNYQYIRFENGFYKIEEVEHD